MAESNWHVILLDEQPIAAFKTRALFEAAGKLLGETPGLRYVLSPPPPIEGQGQTLGWCADGWQWLVDAACEAALK